MRLSITPGTRILACLANLTKLRNVDETCEVLKIGAFIVKFAQGIVLTAESLSEGLKRLRIVRP